LHLTNRNITVPAKYQALTGDRRLEVLRRLALLMQEGMDPDSQDQSIEIDKAIAVGFIEQWKKDTSLGELDATEILNFLVERCSIVREPVANRIDFLHRSFMEYLAANEAVIARSAHVLRTKILSDQWLSTLQFCMDTETGGAYFAGSLIAQMVRFLRLRQRKTDRPRYLRVASLLGHT
jgi:hypothetical protein